MELAGDSLGRAELARAMHQHIGYTLCLEVNSMTNLPIDQVVAFKSILAGLIAYYAWRWLSPKVKGHARSKRSGKMLKRLLSRTA